MTNRPAKNRINVAAKACHQALEQWREAVSSLGKDVSVNGAGIIHDRSAFRDRLLLTQSHIQASLAALDGVDSWPSDADYDTL